MATIKIITEIIKKCITLIHIIETLPNALKVQGKIMEKANSNVQPNPVYANKQSKIRKVLISDWNKTSHAMDTDKAWLPDGYSQIFRSYVFGPLGFWTMAPLCFTAKFDPFLSLVCAPLPPTRRNPSKGRDQILPSGNLVTRRWPTSR